MILESYFLLLISHLPNIFISKKRENFSPSGHFASSDSDRSFQTKKSVGAWLRGEERVNVFQSSS